jgi:uncharacterized protein
MVISKEPVPGKVKTRMCPPLSHEQAAQLAGAALADTFGSVDGADARRKVAVFEGDPTGIVPADWEVIPQRVGGLDVRLADAFDDVLGTRTSGESGSHCAVLVAMDTPQVTARQIDAALDALDTHDAVIGFTEDGGYWIIGLQQACRQVFVGVPMSEATTGEAQLRRLQSLGKSVLVLDTLRDLDTVDDVIAVADGFPLLQLSKWWRSVQ